MENQLTDEELLLLNNVMYMEGQEPLQNVINKMAKNTDMSLGGALDQEIIDALREMGSDIVGDTHTSGKEWADIMEGIKANEALSSLTIPASTAEVQYVYEDSNNGKFACFVTEDNQPIAVARGTGAKEWMDNFESGYLADSLQQERAMAWIESLPYEDITVTGHSKGGNKMKYAALLSDKVSRCVSYDGEGFSVEFFEKYQAEIYQNKHKITAYALDNDFVNIMMPDIYGEKYYLKGYGIQSFEENHCSNSAFVL